MGRPGGSPGRRRRRCCRRHCCLMRFCIISLHTVTKRDAPAKPSALVWRESALGRPPSQEKGLETSSLGCYPQCLQYPRPGKLSGISSSVTTGRAHDCTSQEKAAHGHVTYAVQEVSKTAAQKGSRKSALCCKVQRSKTRRGIPPHQQ